MTKEQEVMDFLHKKVFDPILESPKASSGLKSGVNLTIMRMNKLKAESMVKYFWSAISGTERSIGFSKQMQEAGFNRFEEVSGEFGERFDDAWLSV